MNIKKAVNFIRGSFSYQAQQDLQHNTE